MANYIYFCADCGFEQGLSCSMTSKPDYITCPKCGGEMASRLFPSAVLFRGLGWPTKGTEHLVDRDRIISEVE